MQKLLNSYAERLNYKVCLQEGDNLVSGIMYNENIFSYEESKNKNMKLNEYINSSWVLNDTNMITLDKYDEYIRRLVQRNEEKVVFMQMNMDILNMCDIAELFKSLHNRIIFISSPDIDFPPPKSPYNYDMYFDKTKVPANFVEINYYEKLNMQLIDVIEKNNLYVFAHSVSIDHPRIKFVPIGVFPRFNHFHLKTQDKEILCYANFGLAIDRWFGNPRVQLLEIIENKDFITKENIGDTNILDRNHLNYNVFYEKIAKSKFALCPRGCGIDTYRLWDCISLGCIPIVEKYDGHKQFDDLPILFLENIDEYKKLSEDYLNVKYEELLSKEYNYDKVKFASIEKQLRIFQENLLSPPFGVYLQCHKNSYATYKCLESLRSFYPDCTVVLLSDNGYDFSEMAKHFNCIYVHENENLWLTFKDLDSGEHIINSQKLIKRVYDAFKLCKEDYVMWLEDDVIFNDKIRDNAIAKISSIRRKY
jgi:hypothetical protein